MKTRKLDRAPTPQRRRSSGSVDVAFRGPGGVLAMLEESHELPLVDFQIALRTGSVHDPEGVEGLTRMTARMVRMGTHRLDGNSVEEAIARMGARLSIETGPSFTRFHGTVIRRNAAAFFELLAELLREPAFRARDLAHVRRETLSDIISGRDHDRGLAGRFFRQRIFRDHPYARSVIGSRASVRSIRREDVQRHHAAHYVAPNLVVGAAGDITEEELEALLATHLSGLARKRAPTERLPSPKLDRGRHLVIVDKPERTQTQLIIGTLGSRVRDRDLYPLLVANTAFGGTFTARLMHEVRSVRGWSYDAGSRVGQERQRDAWYMRTSPAAKDAAACARLELELLEAFLDEGISSKELRFAKSYLVNGHCFEIDTAAKRLDFRVGNELFGLPSDHWRKYVPTIRKVGLVEANAAVRKRLSSRDLVITVVATARELRRELEALPGLTSVEVERYDRD